MARNRRKPNQRRRGKDSRSAGNRFVPPQTVEEFAAMSERDQDVYIDAMHIVTDMVNKGMSLSRASREYNRDPREIRKWARPSLRKRGRRRYVPKTTAKQFRLLVMATVEGNREVAILDFPQASQIGKHWAAIDRALGPEEDGTALRTFEGKYIVDINGEEHLPFLTDLVELKRQYSAGNLSFESIYARSA